MLSSYIKRAFKNQAELENSDRSSCFVAVPVDYRISFAPESERRFKRSVTYENSGGHGRFKREMTV